MSNDFNYSGKIKCPRCGSFFRASMAALSRKDNKTLICSACGTAEAFEDFFGEDYADEIYWREDES